MGKLIKPYEYRLHDIRSASDHNTNVLLEGLRELCRALEIVSNQLDQILEQVQKGD